MQGAAQIQSLGGVERFSEGFPVGAEDRGDAPETHILGLVLSPGFQSRIEGLAMDTGVGKHLHDLYLGSVCRGHAHRQALVVNAFLPFLGRGRARCPEGKRQQESDNISHFYLTGGL